ncbi:tRNA dimethylallyltransferase, partial [Bacillus thuringiensis]|uniref:tRNA dimethylallyltransferase n=1 Tax=Bacillus thuringiensis TaxID=1428 RepID=UPI0023EE5B55
LYTTALIGLTMDREVLYDRINSRVDQMMDEGLPNEVKQLYNENIRNCQSVKAIGYKELYAHRQERASLE